MSNSFASQGFLSTFELDWLAFGVSPDFAEQGVSKMATEAYIEVRRRETFCEATQLCEILGKLQLDFNLSCCYGNLILTLPNCNGLVIMSPSIKHPLSDKNLKQRLRNKRFWLLSISIFSFSVLAFFSWLDGVTTYGGRHLSFDSPELNLLCDLAYSNKSVFFSLPQAGISLKIPFGKLVRLGKRYWSLIKIAVCGVLFLILGLLSWWIIRFSWLNRSSQHHRATGLFITKSLVIIIFFLSIFPTPHFNFWWRGYDFISLSVKPSSLVRGLYDFMSNLLVHEGNRFFYAALFTLPAFILKWLGISCFVLFFLGVVWLPANGFTWLEDWLDKLSRLNYKKWLIGGCLWVFILANLISLMTHQHLPAYPEDTAQSFQAQLLAAGELAGPIAFSREFFTFPLLQMDTRWYSDLPPGQSLLLALGHKLGTPWLINPLLASLALGLLYLLTANIYGHPTALLASLLALISPLYLSLSASFLNHLLFILCSLLALLLYYRSLSAPGALYPALTGLCWGAAILTQPLAALALALPFVVYLIKRVLSHEPGFGLKLLAMLIGMVVSLGLLGKYNHLLLGNPWGLVPGYSLAGWLTKGLHAPAKGLFYLLNNLLSLRKQLWGWAIPPFFLILVWILASSRLEGWDYLLLWAIICLLVANFLAYDTRAGLANPLMVAIPFLTMFTARAIVALPTALARFGFSPTRIKSLLAFGMFVCFLFLLTFKLPPLLQPGNSHRLKLASLIKREGVNNAIIFLEQKPFLASFAYNQPDLTNDIIFARHLKNYNRKLIKEFPQRNYYFYDDEANRLAPLKPR